jgi:hypothetical protein
VSAYGHGFVWERSYVLINFSGITAILADFREDKHPQGVPLDQGNPVICPQMIMDKRVEDFSPLPLNSELTAGFSLAESQPNRETISTNVQSEVGYGLQLPVRSIIAPIILSRQSNHEPDQSQYCDRTPNPASVCWQRYVLHHYCPLCPDSGHC